jgi:ABC-type transport system substrate-binding protein
MNHSAEMRRSQKTGCKNRLIATMAAVMVGWLLAGAGAATGPNPGGTLKFGTENDFAGFEALKSGSRLAINGAIAANTIMEPLFRLGSDENLIPVLGLRAEPSEDGKAWTVALRRGVTFHDGTPFNADAVTHHFGRLLNPDNKFRGRAAMGPITAVNKVDAYTVRFELKHAWLPFTRLISSTRGLGGLIPSSAAVESGSQDRAPVGTGPFKFHAWESGDAFTVVKNLDYWAKGMPHLDEIVFKPMTDAQTRYASLQSGQVDIIWMDVGTILDKARTDPSLKVYSGEDNGAEIFILNTSAAPLDDVNVRRALAHAFHQGREVQMAYGDSIPVVHHPFGGQYDCADDGYRAYDPAAARELLAQYGKPVEIEVLHSSSKRGRDIGEITQQLFKDVGVTVHPKGLDFGQVVKKVLGGQYQMSTWRISSWPDQGPTLFQMFHSQSQGNFSRYSNPEMDRLLAAQRTETDPARRNELLCRISRLVNDDVPIIYRGGMRSHLIAKKDIQGIAALENGIVRLESVSLGRQ